MNISTNMSVEFNNISKKLTKEVLKARRRGMNKAASKIRNTTRKLIKSSLPNAAHSEIINAARVTKYREDKTLGEAVAGAHIMGANQKGSREYILRFFEDSSTENRQTRKKHNRGKLTGKHFFGNAVNQELPKAPKIIDDEIKKAIEKLND